ncbi:CatA-like O-acetyltransferase [Fictibacillus terranigra]|uniref:CatA-like O-acetyltransferase n=1 Tax=Fictibacillus terranigra TaxID=3058424 RepID=A0ABT8EAM1_9BACL|nr:CatA-like O-acetyltransferase [Fictibacillus sp. CENA-BCM004]MDN4074969.1 CatA-like O-acetyltransferase [Fictibacillus sp. CENA-BCM004]
MNRENWNRTQYFEHYLGQKCTFSLTAIIDITTLLEQLRNKEIKRYPAFIYMVSRIVNAHVEFRTSFDDEGNLGYWDEDNACSTSSHHAVCDGYHASLFIEELQQLANNFHDWLP